MKTFYRGIGVCILAVLFLLGLIQGSGAQVINMRFAHYAEETHPGNVAAKQFAAKVEERSKGQVQRLPSIRPTSWDRPRSKRSR